MANETYGVGDSNAVKIWSKGIWVATREKVDIGPLMGDDEDSIIHVKNELSKNKGDQVKFNLSVVLNGDGFSEGQRAQGNGEAGTMYQDTILINELGHIYSPPSEYTIDAQRVPWDVRDLGRRKLSEWWETRLSVSFFNHVCGYLPANSAPYGTKYTGLNTVRAHTSGSPTRRLWASTAVSADESLTSSHPFTLNLIDRAITASSIGDLQLRPVMVNGSKKFVCYLHPQQAEDVTTNTSTGQWFSIQQAAIQGGQITKNPIFNGALGVYKDVVLRKSQHVTLGVNSSTSASTSNVRRAVFLGAQAAVCAYSKKGNPAEQKMRWTEKYDDHDRLFEMGAWSVWGLSKAQFNSVDQGVITLSSYSSQ